MNPSFASVLSTQPRPPPDLSLLDHDVYNWEQAYIRFKILTEYMMAKVGEEVRVKLQTQRSPRSQNGLREVNASTHLEIENALKKRQEEDKYVFLYEIEELISLKFKRVMRHNAINVSSFNLPSHKTIQNTLGKKYATFLLKNDDRELVNEEVLPLGTYETLNEVWNRPLTLENIQALNQILNFIIYASEFLIMNSDEQLTILIQYLENIGCFTTRELRIYTAQLLQQKIIDIEYHKEETASCSTRIIHTLTKLSTLIKFSWKLKKHYETRNISASSSTRSSQIYFYYVFID